MYGFVDDLKELGTEANDMLALITKIAQGEAGQAEARAWLEAKARAEQQKEKERQVWLEEIKTRLSRDPSLTQ